MSCPNLEKRQYLLDNLAGIQADIDQYGTRYAEKKWGFGNSTLSRYRREGKLSLRGERHIAHTNLALPAVEDTTAYKALDRCPNHFCTGRLLPNDGYGDEYGHNPLHCEICGKTPAQARAREAEIQAKKTHPPAPRATPAPEIRTEEEPMELTETASPAVQEITAGSAVVTEVNSSAAVPAAGKKYRCPDCPKEFDTALRLGHHRHFEHQFVSPRTKKGTANLRAEHPKACGKCGKVFDARGLHRHEKACSGPAIKAEKQNDRKTEICQTKVEEAVPPILSGKPVDTPPPATKNRPVITGMETRKRSIWLKENLPEITKDILAGLSYRQMQEKWHLSGDTLAKYRRKGLLPFSDGSYSSGKCTTGEAFGSRALLLKPDEKLENGRVYSTTPPKPQPTVFPPFSRWWWPSVQCEWMRTFKYLAAQKPGDSNASGK